MRICNLNRHSRSNGRSVEVLEATEKQPDGTSLWSVVLCDDVRKDPDRFILREDNLEFLDGYLATSC